jgi:hypothetical protein
MRSARRLSPDRASGRRGRAPVYPPRLRLDGALSGNRQCGGKIRAQSFTLDGEAVVCGEDGVAIFDALHRHGTVREAIRRRLTFWRSMVRIFGPNR